MLKVEVIPEKIIELDENAQTDIYDTSDESDNSVIETAECKAEDKKRIVRLKISKPVTFCRKRFINKINLFLAFLEIDKVSFPVDTPAEKKVYFNNTVRVAINSLEQVKKVVCDLNDFTKIPETRKRIYDRERNERKYRNREITEKVKKVRKRGKNKDPDIVFLSEISAAGKVAKEIPLIDLTPIRIAKEVTLVDLTPMRKVISTQWFNVTNSTALTQLVNETLQVNEEIPTESIKINKVMANVPETLPEDIFEDNETQLNVDTVKDVPFDPNKFEAIKF
jgi:hypothetical protein